MPQFPSPTESYMDVRQTLKSKKAFLNTFAFVILKKNKQDCRLPQPAAPEKKSLTSPASYIQEILVLTKKHQTVHSLDLCFNLCLII